MRDISFGQTIVKIGGQEVKIFDRERTVVDAFRYLCIEVALKALRAYLQVEKGRQPDLNKLAKYARKFRVNLMPYIEAFLL